MPTQTPPLPTEHVTRLRGAMAALMWDVRDPEVILAGPFGTGKTRGGLEYVHRCLIEHPGARWLLLRKTLTALTASGLVTFREQVVKPGEARFFGGSKDRPAAFEYPNSSALVVGGMDKPEKILSTEYDGCYVVEATELLEAEWETIGGRLRHGRMPYTQLVGDCNPAGPGHWILRRSREGRLRLLSTTLRDNPAFWTGATWTDAGAAYLSRLEGLTGIRRVRYVEGRWEAAEGALWSYELIRHGDPIPDMVRIVVAVDPSGGDGPEHDEVGIVAVGRGRDNRGYVLADWSGHYTPDGWARRTVALFDDLKADRVVAEANFGGAMVDANLRTVRRTLPITLVHASRGKAIRAEPIAAMYEQGKFSHAEDFTHLEDEMVSWSPLDPSAPSPNRLDALVMAATDLFRRGGEPSVAYQDGRAI